MLGHSQTSQYETKKCSQVISYVYVRPRQAMRHQFYPVLIQLITENEFFTSTYYEMFGFIQNDTSNISQARARQ